MFGDAEHVAAVSNDLKKVLITNEIESGESDTLPLEVLSQGFLNLGKHVRQPIERLLYAWNIEGLHYHRLSLDFLHHCEEFRVDVVESR